MYGFVLGAVIYLKYFLCHYVVTLLCQYFSRWMPLLPWLLHMFHLFGQSVRSLKLDGSVAEKAAPKLPLTPDKSPPFTLTLSASVYHSSKPCIPSPPPSPCLSHLPLLCIISCSFSSSSSLFVFLFLLLSLLLHINICMFHTGSSSHHDTPMDRKLASFSLITLLSATSQRWVVIMLITKKKAQRLQSTK